MLTDQVLTNVGQFWPILTDSCQISRKFDINYLLTCLYFDILYLLNIYIVSKYYIQDWFICDLSVDILIFSKSFFNGLAARGSVGHASAGAAAQPTEASVRGFPYFVHTRRLEGSPRVDFGLPTDV
jgi:hypothetical protein